jgi:hypothetical protein
MLLSDRLPMADVAEVLEAAPTAALLKGTYGVGLYKRMILTPASYCGTGPEYCAAPDCQYQYGPGCDANKVPAGASTANIARPQLGNIAYGGTGIYNCVVPGRE